MNHRHARLFLKHLPNAGAILEPDFAKSSGFDVVPVTVGKVVQNDHIIPLLD